MIECRNKTVKPPYISFSKGGKTTFHCAISPLTTPLTEIYIYSIYLRKILANSFKFSLMDVTMYLECYTSNVHDALVLEKANHNPHTLNSGGSWWNWPGGLRNFISGCRPVAKIEQQGGPKTRWRGKKTEGGPHF